MTDAERTDSLDGWVAVKSDAFADGETHKLGFIVEWNDVESKFAVTCHDRTLQRRGDVSGSRAALFSSAQLARVDASLRGVRDELGPLFPDLSGFREPGLWELLFSGGPRGGAEGPCRLLERYLLCAVELCGRTIVLDALFSLGDADQRDYVENLAEFKRDAMLAEIARAQERILALVRSHGEASGLVQLVKTYQQEEQQYQELVGVSTQFYQHLLQPFRDVRELAALYTTHIQKRLQQEDLGPKRVAELECEVEKWNQRRDAAVHSIQDATAEYFTHTCRALSELVQQMELDQKRFGQASWTLVMERQERLRLLLAKETLQHMRAKEMCVRRKRGFIRAQMRGAAQDVSGVAALELQYYETQLELHDCRAEILRNEELLMLTQIQSTRRHITELQEQVVYYDACQEPQQLEELVQESVPAHLQQRLKQLESRRGEISSRRAQLRSQRELCVQARRQQQHTLLQKSEQQRQHHAVQLKRERRKAEEEEKQQWVETEREKTLRRLRSFREKHPGQFGSHDSDQPLSIISVDMSSSAPRPKGKAQKRREIPVQISLPAVAPPPPPPPPPPPAPPLTDHLPMKTLEQSAGSMDALLASLQRGHNKLRSSQPPRATQSEDARDHLMSAIRQGVALRKAPPPRGPELRSDSELERSIKAAMLRMKKVSGDSEDEEQHSDTPSTDWDS